MGNRDSSVKNGAILKGHLKSLELALVLGDLAINIGQKAVLERSFPC
jgi:hypothetical protein